MKNGIKLLVPLGRTYINCVAFHKPPKTIYLQKNIGSKRLEPFSSSCACEKMIALSKNFKRQCLFKPRYFLQN